MAKTQSLKPRLSDATGYSHKSKWSIAFGRAQLHSANLAEPMGTPDGKEGFGFSEVLRIIQSRNTGYRLSVIDNVRSYTP